MQQNHYTSTPSEPLVCYMKRNINISISINAYTETKKKLKFDSFEL